MKVIKVKLTLTEDMLGTLPSEDIWSKYIRSKSNIPEGVDTSDEAEAIALMAEDPNLDTKGKTVFMRDPKTGKPCIMNYLIKGFFKNAAKTLKDCDGLKTTKLSSFKKKVDNFVFVEPRFIPIETPDGSDIELGECQRPLRASTMQGERVSIACSESVPKGCTLTIDITCLDKKTLDMVPEWLDYGRFNGLGQWHNSGKGTFTWELIETK